jgi:hypothetical protein
MPPTTLAQRADEREDTCVPSSPDPAILVRTELERLRADGCEWSDADFDSIVRRALAGQGAQNAHEWREVMDEHRRVWRAAYEGGEMPFRFNAALLVEAL